MQAEMDRIEIAEATANPSSAHQSPIVAALRRDLKRRPQPPRKRWSGPVRIFGGLNTAPR